MKHQILLAFLAVGLLVGCKPNSSTPTNEAGNYISSNATDKREAKIVQASVLAPLIATWEVQVTAGISKAERRKPYEGRWFTLRGDQSFTTGMFDKETNQGMYEYDGETNLIDFIYDSPEIGMAEQFEIKGVGVNDSSVLIWLGNTPKNPAGMQLKMVKLADASVQ